MLRVPLPGVEEVERRDGAERPFPADAVVLRDATLREVAWCDVLPCAEALRDEVPFGARRRGSVWRDEELRVWEAIPPW